MTRANKTGETGENGRSERRTRRKWSGVGRKKRGQRETKEMEEELEKEGGNFRKRMRRSRELGREVERMGVMDAMIKGWRSRKGNVKDEDEQEMKRRGNTQI